MMTDQQALLAAIIAAPGDPTPWLVYADWLEENGRAALAKTIRRRVARAVNVGMAPRWELAELPDAWCPHGTGGTRNGLPGLAWHNGLVVVVRCTLAEWLEHGPLLCELHPITRVEVADVYPVELIDGWHWPVSDVTESRLVWDLYDLMPHNPYGTKSSATDALSTACLKWTRPWHRPRCG